MRLKPIWSPLPFLLVTACDPSAAPAAVATGSVATRSTATPVAVVATPVAVPAAIDAPAAAATGEAAATLPADVRAFKKRRDECDHFRGEEPYDAERAAFLRAALSRTCDGTDAELAALRRRYAADATVVAALADYDDLVEPGQDEQ